ncbi:hypothetical protein M2132_002429 [Dysgonomonas sp. PH5-45]|uniref:hypothetical protein n=1 Tax=unclassified Dysgonomonas TaxID=2630389 RepID=UPI0024758FC9|nr:MULTISPECIES: hypothetical protein [unclassified Dysgonomonas]MDH6356071.1 hypothetical protein [Dysgonomonas sp. PH5-45]MDH6388965.1 hypothetical protein [Dysgonomonas sp. PH5-37]
MEKKINWEKYGVITSVIFGCVSLILSIRSCSHSKNANEIAKESNRIAGTANITAMQANEIAKQANDTANYISKQLLEIEIGRDKRDDKDREEIKNDAKKRKIENILSQANLLFDKKNYEEAYNKYIEYKRHSNNGHIGGEKFGTLSKNILAANPDSEEGKKYQQWSKELLK